MHELVSADNLLALMEADVLIADEAFDADAPVLARLAVDGKTAWNFLAVVQLATAVIWLN